RFLKSKNELLDNITQLLGGRVSEEMNFADITSGAQNDLERATKITRKLITEYGMSDRLGPVTFKGEEDEVFLGKEIATRPHYSENIASAIDEETHNIIISSYEKARKILEENKLILARLAKELMEKETLSRDEILKVLAKVETKKVKKPKVAAVAKETETAERSSRAKSAVAAGTVKKAQKEK
ncbi:MAG: cell division protein FtsH, partial [Actinomycetota bacterium]